MSDLRPSQGAMASASKQRTAGPRRGHIIETIIRREVRLASRRRGVRALFVMSLMPLAVFALILVIRVAGEQTLGVDMGWDPVLSFLEVQVYPVLLLALGLGTPIVATDRSEDVLFLYATRPVGPLDYTLGKLFAVALPAVALLLVPGAIIAGLRWGILRHVGALDSLMVLVQVAVASLFIAWALAGITLAASALTQSARWSLMVALALLVVPDTIGGIASLDFAIGPNVAIQHLLRALIEGMQVAEGVIAGVVLLLYGLLGAVVPIWRVRTEMTP